MIGIKVGSKYGHYLKKVIMPGKNVIIKGFAIELLGFIKTIKSPPKFLNGLNKQKILVKVKYRKYSTKIHK